MCAHTVQTNVNVWAPFTLTDVCSRRDRATSLALVGRWVFDFCQQWTPFKQNQLRPYGSALSRSLGFTKTSLPALPEHNPVGNHSGLMGAAVCERTLNGNKWRLLWEEHSGTNAEVGGSSSSCAGWIPVPLLFSTLELKSQFIVQSQTHKNPQNVDVLVIIRMATAMNVCINSVVSSAFNIETFIVEH